MAAAATKKAYMMAFIKANDPSFDAYLPMLLASLDSYGGAILGSTNFADTEAEGGSSEGAKDDFTCTVIVEFPSLERAQAWEAGPEHAETKAFQQSASSAAICVAEGSGEEPEGGVGALAMLCYKVTDPKFEDYLSTAEASLGPQGGKSMCRAAFDGGLAENTTGREYTAMATFGFPSLEKAMAWYGSEAYAPAKALRQTTSEGPIAVFKAERIEDVEGMFL